VERQESEAGIDRYIFLNVSSLVIFSSAKIKKIFPNSHEFLSEDPRNI
jgi:hypothetical protein